VELGGGLPSPGKMPEVIPSASALATFLAPFAPAMMREVAGAFNSITIYREFNTGPRSAARWGVSANIPGEALVEGGDNLAMVLNRMDVTDSIAGINAYLNRFSEHFHDVKVSTKDNIVQLLLKETGLSERITGIRLSDGTLKFLCLLAVLLQKDPPPLICIEEPELGLHPDAVQLVAEVLVEASARTQLVVTTHSEALVDGMSSQPENVIVCERDFDWSTQFKRLKHDDLRTWLERYKLGQLWRLGEIGGTRW
jgi:predicted ATPase